MISSMSPSKLKIFSCSRSNFFASLLVSAPRPLSSSLRPVGPTDLKLAHIKSLIVTCLQYFYSCFSGQRMATLETLLVLVDHLFLYFSSFVFILVATEIAELIPIEVKLFGNSSKIWPRNSCKAADQNHPKHPPPQLFDIHPPPKKKSALVCFWFYLIVNT